MSEKISSPKNSPSNARGRTRQIFRTPVSKRMIANAANDPVGAIRSPLKRDGSGLKSEPIHTKSGARNAQTAIAPHNSEVPQNIFFKQLLLPKRSTKRCVNKKQTAI